MTRRLAYGIIVKWFGVNCNALPDLLAVPRFAISSML
jgi:hypothetical protein